MVSDGFASGLMRMVVSSLTTRASSSFNRREVSRINGNHQCLTGNVIAWRTGKYGIYWLAPCTAGRQSVGRGFDSRQLYFSDT